MPHGQIKRHVNSSVMKFTGTPFPEHHFGTLAAPLCTLKFMPWLKQCTAHIKATPRMEGNCMICWSPSVGSVTKPILSGAFKYIHLACQWCLCVQPEVVVVKYQAIYVETMDHMLLCQIQMWENDIKLDECPKCIMDNFAIWNLACYYHWQLLKILLLYWKLYAV